MRFVGTWIGLLLCGLMVSLQFRDFYHAPLEGDLPAIALPAPSYNEVLSSPFATSVLLDQARYPGTNRFFAYASLKLWFDHVPRWVPVSRELALYLSSALLKLLALGLLCLGAMLLLTPRATGATSFGVYLTVYLGMMVSSGEEMHYLNWIDPSITYAWFYAGHLGLCLVMAALIVRHFHKVWAVSAIAVATPMLALGGPLNAPVLLFLALGMVLYQRLSGASTRGERLAWWGTALWIAGWASYSWYVGRFNSENFWASLPLAERYARLWHGIGLLLKGPWISWILLSLPFGIYAYWKKAVFSRQERIVLLLCVGAMGLWLFLLPVGGYREYRPWIVRRDTLLPLHIVWAVLILLVLQKIWTREALRLKVVFVIWMAVILGPRQMRDWIHQPDATAEQAQLHLLLTAETVCPELPRTTPLMDWSFEGDCDDPRNSVLYLRRLGWVKQAEGFRYAE